jgi:hypothetical protein
LISFFYLDYNRIQLFPAFVTVPCRSKNDSLLLKNDSPVTSGLSLLGEWQEMQAVYPVILAV